MLLGWVFSGFQIIPVALMAVCIIDILRKDRPREWIWLVVILPIVGSLIYLGNFYLADSFGWRRLDLSYKRGKRLRELKTLSLVQDTAGLWLEMGELHFQRREWTKALEALRHAIDHDPELLKAQYYAGVALLESGRADAAIIPLQYVIHEQSDYAFGDARMALARALEAIGRDAEALSEYDEVLKANSYAEAVVRRARVLKRMGRDAEARESLAKLLREAALVPRKDRKWLREARKQ